MNHYSVIYSCDVPVDTRLVAPPPGQSHLWSCTERDGPDGQQEDKPAFYSCGICDHWHPAKWNGDCRDDANRLTTSYLEDTYGNEGEGWIEVPMPDNEEGGVPD